MLSRMAFLILVSIAGVAFPVGFSQTVAQPSIGHRQYVGSTSCKTCHPQIYARWEKTRMANVVRDPKQHPDAILPDLSKPDSLVSFRKDDIAYVYGSKWKQRYFRKSGTIISFFPRSGMSRTRSGGRTLLSLKSEFE
jgi:hypothetical protein